MKQGKSLQELAQEVHRQKDAKRDYQLDTRRLEMTESGSLTLDMSGATDGNGYLLENLNLDVNDIAHRQIGTHLNIPAAYYDKMRDENPRLLADNVNTWFRQYPSERMVRTLDGHARAFLSNRYRRIDHCEIIEHIMPIIGEIPDVHIHSCEITEQRMYIKIINPRLEREVKKGDIVQSGMVISNSEVGRGSVNIQPLVFRLVCLNGMTVNDAATRRYHIGRGNEANERFELYTNDTLRAIDNAFLRKIQDTVRAVVDETQFAKVIELMQKASNIQITGDIPQVVELAGKEIGLSKEEGAGVLDHLIRGGDLTQYGLSNAITRYSQDVADYDRASDLESAGYDALLLPPSIWRHINDGLAA